MKTAILTIFSGAVLFFASGCASTYPSQTTSRYIDRDAVRANVKTALWSDPAVNPFDLGVDVSRSTVHLTGVVDTPEQRTRAAQIALAVPGVSNVRNDVAVRPVLGVSGYGLPARAEVGVISEDPAILLGRVVAGPDLYYGKDVELQGTVDTVLSPNSFTMYSVGAPENALLVLSTLHDVRDISPGDVVRVRGELEPFNRIAAGQRLHADLEARKFDPWASHASVLADSVRKMK
jgi:hyperosmotically inducible protein